MTDYFISLKRKITNFLSEPDYLDYVIIICVISRCFAILYLKK